MFWLGLNKDSRGYGAAVNAFERDGTPLKPKMCAALAEELGRAACEIATLRQIVEASQAARKRKGKRGKAQ